MPPKKKLSKKEKARLEAEQAELLRIEMEKEKQRKLEEERQRRELERQEAIRRQQNEIEENKKRRTQLKASMAFFDNVRQQVDAMKMRTREEIEWQKFMRCNGLPDPNSPSQLREYLHQWKVAIEERERESRNWLLSTDERTLLTHDAHVQDLTRAALRKKQGNLGDVYAKRVAEAMGVLRELDEAIADKKKATHITEDLIRLKTEMRVFLKEFLDKFTYKTMSHIDRDMEIDRPGVCRHEYSSDVFKSHIWTFSKDAQLSANPRARIGEQNQTNEVIFPSIGMEIQLPPPVQLPSSAMRGLWLNFDHFSDYCPSFSLKKPRPDNINILYQTKKEWQKRKEILKNLIDECSLDSPMLTTALPSHENSVASRKPKERSYDIDKIYAEYEEELNKAQRRAIGPDAFGLLDTDVNLRKYRIIGGVYCIDHLDTPEQDKRLNAHTFIRTIIAPDRITHKTFFQTYKPPPPVQPGVRRLPEEIEAEMRMIEAALEKLALATVQLPDSVIWFEPPVACRWETQMEAFEADLTEGVKPPQATATPTEMTPLSTTANPSPLKSSPRRPMRLGRGDETLSLPVREVTDFDMLRIPPDIDIHGLMRDFVVPRLPSGFVVRVEETIEANEGNERKCKEKQQKVLFLARHQPHRPHLESNNEMAMGQRQYGGSGSDKVNIDVDYVDLDEPRELFPVVKLSKRLVFKGKVAGDESTGVRTNEHGPSPGSGPGPGTSFGAGSGPCLAGSEHGNVNGNATHNDNANPNKSNGHHSRNGNGNAATNGCANNTTTTTNTNNNGHNANNSSGSGSGNKRPNKAAHRFNSTTKTTGQKAAGMIRSRNSTYMFSELIEDLDNLVGLQTAMVEEALNQISASFTSSMSSTGDSAEQSGADAISPSHDDDDDDDEANAHAAAADDDDNAARHDETDDGAAFAYGIPGISLLRDLAIGGKGNGNGNDTGDKNGKDNASDDASSSEFDDEYADDLDLEGATAFSPSSTARRQQQGICDGSGGDIQDFLSKHNQSELDTSFSSGHTEEKRHKLSSIEAFKRGKWSVRDVHDQKFNEDKLSIQFRTGRLGIFGFALNRYSNMPYQTWELKPDFKSPGTILFSFTASIISIEVTISSEGYCVNSFQGGSTDGINNMIGQIYSLDELKSILIASAVDIFPEEDAFCYTEGSCEKNYVMEMHTYACMATLALSHNFSWSRWNLLAGNRTAVLLMRELIEGKKVPYHSTLLVTPLKTAIIDCTEVSASFNAVGIAGMEYYADLYQLSQVYALASSLEKQRTMEPMLRDNVARLFMAIRPLSFC